MVIFPAVTPSIIRPINTHQKLGARAVINQPTAEPKTLIAKIRLRPILSERRQRSGEATKLHKAYIQPIIPIQRVLAPNCVSKIGNRGKIIVSHMRSSAMVVKTAVLVEKEEDIRKNY